MRSHADIWSLIDTLAARHGLSPSGLAKKAGLDPTTFNKSKRFSADGRPRWPSTESLAKVLDATGASVDEMIGALVRPGGGIGGLETKAMSPPPRTRELSDGPVGGPLYEQASHVPLLGLSQAGTGGFFDDGGRPVGAGWDEVSFPGAKGEALYALEVSDDSMEPVYRDGDIIIVSPTSEFRRGDRVVVKTRHGEVLASSLVRHTNLTIELASFNPIHPDRTLRTDEVEWVARIVWASQ